MATYTIVSSNKATLGPGEIRAGSTIQVGEGDVFVIGPGADAKVTFQAAGGTPKNFSVSVQNSNANSVTLKFESNLTPTVNVADNVNVSNLAIDAKAASAINLNAGNNVRLGKYEGSDKGTDTINIGDGFTTTQEWKTSGGNDVITVGDNATFAKLDTADGDDTITLGANARATEIDAGAGNDVVNTQTDGLTIKNAESVSIVCYAPGTLIDTPGGPRAVETLQPSDFVNTLDNGPQEILWVRQAEQPLDSLERDSRPVLISAGALGAGRPAQDLIVSPQHRILVGGGGQLQGCFRTEAFAPAKALSSLRGIRPMLGKRQITWIHFACKTHEVVLANGCLSESLLLGPMVTNGLTSIERRVLTDIFGSAPAPRAALNGPAARECLSTDAARRQIRERHKERRCRLAQEISKWDADLAEERSEAEFGAQQQRFLRSTVTRVRQHSAQLGYSRRA